MFVLTGSRVKSSHHPVGSGAGKREYAVYQPTMYSTVYMYGAFIRTDRISFYVRLAVAMRMTGQTGKPCPPAHPRSMPGPSPLGDSLKPSHGFGLGARWATADRNDLILREWRMKSTGQTRGMACMRQSLPESGLWARPVQSSGSNFREWTLTISIPTSPKSCR